MPRYFDCKTNMLQRGGVNVLTSRLNPQISLVLFLFLAFFICLFAVFLLVYPIVFRLYLIVPLVLVDILSLIILKVGYAYHHQRKFILSTDLAELLDFCFGLKLFGSNPGVHYVVPLRQHGSYI